MQSQVESGRAFADATAGHPSLAARFLARLLARLSVPCTEYSVECSDNGPKFQGGVTDGYGGAHTRSGGSAGSRAWQKSSAKLSLRSVRQATHGCDAMRSVPACHSPLNRGTHPPLHLSVRYSRCLASTPTDDTLPSPSAPPSETTRNNTCRMACTCGRPSHCHRHCTVPALQRHLVTKRTTRAARGVEFAGQKSVRSCCMAP